MSVARQAIRRRKQAVIDPRYKGRKGRDVGKMRERELAKVHREQLRRMRMKSK